MKSKKSIMFIALVAMASTLFAQTTIRALHKGDYIPADLAFGKVINSKKKVAKFSEYKGKLLIIDFWATHCGPCVAGLPRMDSLQRQFGDRVAIVTVTTEKEKLIGEYLKRKNYVLPAVVEDSVLKEVFPYTALDLHVGINEEGKIIGNTSGEEVNAGTVGEYLRTGKLIARERIDIRDAEEKMRNLIFGGDDEAGDGIIARSILAKNVVGDNGGGGGMQEAPMVNNIKMYKSCYFRNVNVTQLFEMVLDKGRIFNLFFIENIDGSIVPMNVANNVDDAFSSINGWMVPGNQLFCYCLKLPLPGVRDSVFVRQYMLEDLNRYFSFTARIEKRKIPCWILVKADQSKIIYADRDDSSEGTSLVSDSIDGDYLEGFQNMPIDRISHDLADHYYMLPVLINGTGLTNERIYLKNLHFKMTKDHANRVIPDLNEWRAAFQKYGFEIKVEDREQEVMIFKRKKGWPVM